jgi:thiazole/oxazole-forming peptide maturase SagD family component
MSEAFQDESPLLPPGPVLISDPSLGCPVVVAAARIRSPQDADRTPRFATGWGVDFKSASRQCLHEAQETHYAQIVPRATRARFEALTGAVAPPDLLLISERQFETRARWNETHAGRDAIPPRWLRDHAIGWLAADAGTGAAVAFVPAGLCGLGYHPDEAAGLPLADSNGLATGETFSDATIRAFFELVERDACAIWWYNRLVLPRLDLAALGDPLVTAYRAWLETRGRRLVLLDLTHDLAIPVAAALSNDVGGGRLACGFGAGVTAGAAARHAVGELAQCEANLALMQRQVLARGTAVLSAEARHLFAWWEKDDLRAYAFLQGGDYSAPQASEARFELDWCRKLCQRHGLALLAVDLTSDRGPPLARVFVPGLRPIRPRFGPGRLYDVPRRMGFPRLTEEALNPTLFPL